MNNELLTQINESPEPLRSYIHELVAFDGSLYVQEIFALRQQRDALALALKLDVGKQ